MSDLHLFAVTSGWDGPFQLSEVIVAEAREVDAVDAAAEAFAAAGQPICRAKMRIADLGVLGRGVMVGPRAADRPLDAPWRAIDQRCAPIASDTVHAPGGPERRD